MKSPRAALAGISISRLVDSFRLKTKTLRVRVLVDMHATAKEGRNCAHGARRPRRRRRDDDLLELKAFPSAGHRLAPFGKIFNIR
eukprot:scaffold1936_cov362-Pinguiococcus_pyrenoidosus.AAC.6